MITIERISNATYGRSEINSVSGMTPELQDPMKPPETPAAPTVPDNDSDISSIHSNLLRGKLADIQGNFRRNNALSSAIQNYRQLLALLQEKREQIREQLKELAHLKRKRRNKKAQDKAIQEKINSYKKQVNDLVNKTHFDGNKIFTAAGQDMTISLGNDVVINIPAKDFSIGPKDVDLSENPDVLLEKEKGASEAIMDYSEFLLDVEKKIGSSTTQMELELGNILEVEQDPAKKDMTMELAKFTTALVLQETRHALQSQAHVTAASAVALLINAS